MVRREAYGLAAQKWAEKPLGRPQAPTFCLIGRYPVSYTHLDHFWDAYSFSLEEIRNCFAEDGITMTYNHLNVHIVENRTKEK